MRENRNFDGRAKGGIYEGIAINEALHSIFSAVDNDIYLVRPYFSADNILRIKIIAGRQIVYDSTMKDYSDQRTAANSPLSKEKLEEYQKLAKKAPKKWG